jgi:integrase
MPRKPRRRPWGGGSIKDLPEGAAHVFWRERGRKRSHRCKSRAEADLFLARKLVTLKGGGEAAPDGVKASELPTLNELAQEAGGWLERRQRTHADARNDRNRWKNHVAPTIGRLRPDQVDVGELRHLIEERLRVISRSTVRLVLRLLSTFFSDLVDDGVVAANPVKSLPRRLRRLVRPAHDPKTTPFLERMDDVRRVYLALPDNQIRVAFAVGALAGLRTGEVLALRWEHVDLEAARIHVRVKVKEGKVGRLKDDDSRIVPIQDDLLPILKAAKLRTGHELVVPPLRRRRKFMKPSTLWKALRKVRAAAQPPLPAVNWYQATRHTYASQWVMAGGDMRELQMHLGHSTVLVTERYAHLRPGAFSPEARKRLRVDLSTPAGAVVHLGTPAGTDGTKTAPQARGRKEKNETEHPRITKLSGP